MSGSLNKVMLIGNLGADPEIRRLNSGDPVVNMRIATSETWRDANGDRQERTEWHSVVIFNENLAKVAEQYLKKGMKVFLEGKHQTRKWQDQHGADRYSTEVVLQKSRGELVMLGQNGSGRPPGPTGQDDYGTQSGRDRSETRGAGAVGGGSRELDDEIPF
ncbi:single-strand DNA-binding protein [Mesorhizobium albiziae]|uniref:Single-stranded DNA-binding protein n=1 Tax=Neomesorhizobium albiziae TaxID=335020 RepID=A0A1I4BLJ1_9HYPH|nr:single-stranded DNA-binding protein [Mesorhizobium albiziae]GLS29920.1 single-stranded DNA-binding protein [Mesorhizobium albiziae]SFK68859.1 single-strand DNA-binding protein [Mesorhizobium albiziae]